MNTFKVEFISKKASEFVAACGLARGSLIREAASVTSKKEAKMRNNAADLITLLGQQIMKELEKSR